VRTTDKYKPGLEFGATSRLESAVKDLMSATEFINKAIVKLHSVHSGECPHDSKVDTSTMGEGPESFHCNDCDREFILLEG